MVEFGIMLWLIVVIGGSIICGWLFFCLLTAWRDHFRIISKGTESYQDLVKNNNKGK